MKIYSSAPCRISLLGGGTDIPTYSDKFGGLCLNMAINIRQHFTLTDSNGIENIYPKGANPKFYEEFYKHFAWQPETCISTFDGILESGLGSSAAAAVALVGGLNRANRILSDFRKSGKGINYRFSSKLDKEWIAETAWNIEVNNIGLFGGRQDQYASTFGGCNLFEFNKRNKEGVFGGVKVTRLDGFIEKILPSLMLFHIGSNRKSADIQEGFKDLSYGQIEQLHKIKESVLEGSKIIASGNIENFGKFMDKVWKLKKKSNKGVSNPNIDDIYSRGIKLGAYGGKLCGSGGGGCILFVVDPEIQDKFKEEIGLKWIDFSIDQNGVETRVEL